MASILERWEKDPLFPAAEEVQESADRMESTYRTWIHTMNDASSLWNTEEIRRDLKTAIGTAKWQLEEFSRAAKPGQITRAFDDARDRHREFIIAIDNQISNIEGSLQKDALERNPPSPLVRMNGRELDEFALFLAGPKLPVEKTSTTGVAQGLPPACLHNTIHSTQQGLLGHRRSASASADIGAWKVSVSDEHFPCALRPSPPKVPSFSCLLSTMESAYKASSSGMWKSKVGGQHHEVGIIQRGMQGFQSEMLHDRPIQVIASFLLILCMIGIGMKFFPYGHGES